MIETSFDVLLSFAGPERAYAQAIHAICTANGLRVFLDEEFQHEIWGQNLVEYLDRTYRERGAFCVALFSQAYCERAYTKVERRAAFDRMLSETGPYLLPVKVDDAWPEGLPRATAYLDLRVQGVVGVCEVLCRKIKNITNISIPPDCRIPRIPVGRIPAEQLSRYLIELCRQQPVAAFGVLVYDERSAELRKLLRDRDYWDALDSVSGPHFEILAIRDQESYETEVSTTIELMTAASLSRSRSRGYYFSRLLKNYFGEERTTLVYPSLLVFLVAQGRVQYSRLIPFHRATVEETFTWLRDLLALIAKAISDSKDGGSGGVDGLWASLREALLEGGYTVYIQNAPAGAEEAISKLVGYVEQPAAS